jgi:uncharacterized protein (TIGR00369 family)
MNTQAIPDGFLLFGKDQSFNDALYPAYIKVDDSGPTVGLLLEKQHCNFVGFCHGGVMMTLMDIALSGAVCFALGKYTSTPTVSSSFDFMAGAKEGDWIYGDIHSVKLTRTMGFASATIEGPNGSVARASACFKLPGDVESAPGMGIEEYHQWRTSI